MRSLSADFDIAVIGAGMAGLTCAQQLQKAGYRVAVLEKSRGVGGRVATRRLHDTVADHGTCYLTPKGDLFRALVDRLVAAGVVQSWTDTVHELSLAGDFNEPSVADRYPRYIAPKGMTAIAKFLATSLDIRFSHLVQTITLSGDDHWQLTSQKTHTDLTTVTETLTARAIVVAIPAPQAASLLQSISTSVLPDECLRQVQSVAFTPCLSVMAGYAPDHQQDWVSHYPNVRAITFIQDENLAWIGLDSSKRSTSPQPVFVVQSTATFAETYLEAIDLQAAGDQLLKHAAERLVPWLANPDWLQVHRWRYAFARSPLSAPYLTMKTPIPLACVGDWCGGVKVEQAFLSGLAGAEYVNQQLRD